MTSITLEENIPLLVTPTALSIALVQNSMTTNDDPLMASTHGDPALPWVKIPPGDYLRFDTAMYFMQKSWKAFTFPVIEV